MAVITINTPGAQDARILIAFGRRLRLTDAAGAPRDATPAEVRAAIIAYIVQTVQGAEQDAAVAAAAAGVTPVTPT